ncbi:LysR family transcriptional regulator [Azohydromonas caseinilytica]|uniref:LysR family transcriptional regulator n=1 Tax=Azohydromonas caseinilytica TaxID=2728836 RepID=A0A848FE29_9BURK|nr:LysR family transcriptional regulator [Azohydromonas caseinilytica]NML16629.1 LysR family transcriptional regulator [Azohydromonas caseinilytica]
MDLEAMRIFVRVAELQSFTQAAQVLGLPRATVSAAVQRLESQLAVRLLQRTTRQVRMTPDGERFYARCRELLVELEELQGMFRPDPAGVQGRLRVDMPTGTARHVVVPRLLEFLQAHPELHIELGSTDRRVDLVGEGFDCVLRVGPLDDSSLVARPLGHFARINCASRPYLERHGVPRTPQELRQHRLVHYAAALGAAAPGFEYVDPEGGEVRHVPMAGSLTVNNAQAYEAACLAGLGIIQAPDVGLRQHLRSGELVEILPGHRAAPLPVTLLYPSRQHMARRLQVFMDWLQSVLRPHLMEASGARG